MKNKTYYSRVTQITLSPKEDFKLCDDLATKITIEEESGRELVEIARGYYVLRIDPAEWVSLKVAIDSMIKDCRVEDNNEKGGVL